MLLALFFVCTCATFSSVHATVNTKTVKVAMGQILVVDSDRAGNLARMEIACQKAVHQKADIILFPETSILGWVNPEAWHLADSIPGNDTHWIGELAKRYKLMIGVGMTEKYNATTLHDTGVLIDINGDILLIHRKINILSYLMTPPYTPGKLIPENIAVVDTRFGRIGMLICADTFKVDIMKAMGKNKPDIVLVPYGWAAPFDHWPQHGLDLQHRVQTCANLTGATVVGVDNVGTVAHGPWQFQEYGGWSVASTHKGKVLAVAADRDVDLKIVDIVMS
eukprot:TRINITY_DN67781_c5_g5_i1.p1 TRINITY_DN67781_c5_g5~~TRINITY_DN67781_c5_g5_i1.p1  ORF type:complete len:279 (+),score=38.60 TRINITY_DN67781_c5_g5_i1:37-873(+)